MFELGAVGSPADVATLVLVTVVFKYEIRPANRLRSAAIVALARREESVDDALLEADLGVEERDVQKVTRPLIACGGEDGA